MASNKFSLFVVAILLGFIGYPSTSIALQTYNQNPNFAIDYCVANRAAPNEKLQGYIDYVCGRLNCEAIQPNGSCFLPNTLLNHGSYALDLEYKINGKCNLDIGGLTTIDPSYDNCRYP